MRGASLLPLCKSGHTSKNLAPRAETDVFAVYTPCAGWGENRFLFLFFSGAAAVVS